MEWHENDANLPNFLIFLIAQLIILQFTMSMPQNNELLLFLFVL